VIPLYERLCAYPWGQTRATPCLQVARNYPAIAQRNLAQRNLEVQIRTQAAVEARRIRYASFSNDAERAAGRQIAWDV